MLGQGEAWEPTTSNVYLIVHSPLIILSVHWFRQVAMKRVKSMVRSGLRLFVGNPFWLTPICCCRGRFDRLPHHLVPKNVLELARNLKAKATSRGCGPTLWKWILKQPWSDSHHFNDKWSYSVVDCHGAPEYTHTDAWTIGIQGKSLPSPFLKPSLINLERMPAVDLNPLIQLYWHGST